jgi:hypothetical protein
MLHDVAVPRHESTSGNLPLQAHVTLFYPRYLTPITRTKTNAAQPPLL